MAYRDETATFLRLNAYGRRWHVVIEGRGIVFSANTKRSCIWFCQRHGIGYQRAA